jgi:hypothetical protein
MHNLLKKHNKIKSPKWILSEIERNNTLWVLKEFQHDYKKEKRKNANQTI